MIIPNKLSVIGGGITGLYAALCALDRGYTHIHVYEASASLGGKIKSLPLNGRMIDMGAEFIDSDDELMLALCKRLGVKLNVCDDQKSHNFQDRDGHIIGDFFERYKPVAERIIADRKEILRDPNGVKARRIEKQSLADYMQQIQREPAFANIPAIIFDTAISAFMAEVGQPAEQVTASQFIAETMRSAEKFLVSDCGYRVEGGMGTVIHALHQELKTRGVTFHTNERLAKAEKQVDGIDLLFHTASGPTQIRTHKAILAVPAYAVAQIEGLESFGLPADTATRFGHMQYARMIKFSVPLQEGITLPNINMFSHGVQSYQPMPGYVTFICHNSGTQNLPAFIRDHLAQYARAFHKKPEELFDMQPGCIQFENPDKKPCFATPSPQEKERTGLLLKQVAQAATQGFGITGTYFPLEGAIGFMECGLDSVEKTLGLMHMRGQSLKPNFIQRQCMPTGYTQAERVAKGSYYRA